MSAENRLREDIVRFSKSLFDRGLSVGSAGNISAAVEDGILMTPTNSCLGFLDPACLAKLDFSGNHVSGDKPSKEVFLHRAFYETRRQTGQSSTFIRPSRPLCFVLPIPIRTTASRR